jgi:hypothetical protein
MHETFDTSESFIWLQSYLKKYSWYAAKLSFTCFEKRTMSEKEPMNMNDSLNPVWKKVGEYILSDNGNLETFDIWLIAKLEPFNLGNDFLTGILKAALKCTRRGSNEEDLIQLVRLSFFVPPGQIPKGKIWGFFNTERFEIREGNPGSIERTINFYLYVED